MDRANEGTARLNLGYSRIVAPVAGRVGLRPIDVGNYIGAGDANGVAVITQLAPIDVAFSVPQDRVPEMQASVAAGAQLAGRRVRPDAHEASSTTASSRRSTTRSTSRPARSRRRRASPTPATALFPNQFVNVRLLLRSVEGAVVVPVTAMRHGPNGDFVYVLNDDRTVTRAAGRARRRDQRRDRRRQGPRSRRARRHRRRRPAARRRARAARRASGRRRAPAAARRRRGRRGAVAARPPARRQRRSASGGSRPMAAEPRPDGDREPVASLHPAPGGDLAADGGDRPRRPGRLPLPAAVGAAAGRLPDDPGADALPGREPRGDGATP